MTILQPCIYLRATIAEAEYIEKEIEQPGNGAGGAYRPPPRTKEVQVNRVLIYNIFFLLSNPTLNWKHWNNKELIKHLIEYTVHSHQKQCVQPMLNYSLS